MKSWSCIFTLLLLLEGFSQAQNKTPLYRLVCHSNEHFYTTSTAEREKVEKEGCKTEGEVGIVSGSQAPGFVPVYRLRSSGKTGGHFLTASASERAEVIQHQHFKPEGVAFYILAKQQPGTLPMYRMFDPNTRDHFYTANAAERDEAKQRDGFKTEGILGYVWETSPEKLAKRSPR